MMTWPMIVLAVGSVGAGGLLAIGGTLEHWLEPVVGAHEEAHHAVPGLGDDGHHAGGRSRSASAIAYRMYATRPDSRDRATRRVGTDHGGPQRPLRRRVQRGRLHAARASSSPLASSRSTTTPSTGCPGGSARVVGAASKRLGRLQTGFARSYALSMLAGAALVVARHPGGEGLVNGMPWLTVLWAVPMFGAARGDPAAVGRPRPRQVPRAGAVAGRAGDRRRCWPSNSTPRARSTSSSKTTDGFRRSAPATSWGSTASRWPSSCSPRCWCRC